MQDLDIVSRRLILTAYNEHIWHKGPNTQQEDLSTDSS